MSSNVIVKTNVRAPRFMDAEEFLAYLGAKRPGAEAFLRFMLQDFMSFPGPAEEEPTATFVTAEMELKEGYQRMVVGMLGQIACKVIWKRVSQDTGFPSVSIIVRISSVEFRKAQEVINATFKKAATEAQASGGTLADMAFMRAPCVA